MISIIIPAYNRADLLEKTLNSIRKQKFIKYEVLVIDDNSNNNDIENISKKYNVRYFKNTKNLGAQVSRNIGIEKAQFDYIAFLDSDDIWLSEDKLYKQYKIFKNNYNISLVYTKLQYIDEHDYVISTQKNVDNELFTNFTSKILKKDMIGTYSSVMVKKSDLIQCGMCNIDLPARQDWDLWIRLSLLGDAYVINNTIVQYRLHPNQISSNVEKKIDGFASLLNIHKDLFVKNHQLLDYYKHLFKIFLLANFTKSKNKNLEKLRKDNLKLTILINQVIVLINLYLKIPFLGNTLKTKFAKTYLFKGISI